jgi:hypothetical protein
VFQCIRLRDVHVFSFWVSLCLFGACVVRGLATRASQRLLDPRHALGGAFWARQKTKHDNPSVKSTTAVLKLLQVYTKKGVYRTIF